MITLHLDRARLRGLAKGSLYKRERALLRLAAALDAPLLDTSPADLLAWRANLAPLAPKTIRCYVSHAHQFYSWAFTEGLVDGNPAAGLPVPPRPRRLPRPISEKHLLAALDAAPPRVRPWLVLAAWAGLRAKEIALLRRENVLDSAPRPVILVAIGATKGSTERAVPMSAFVLTEIRPILPTRGWVFRPVQELLGHASPDTTAGYAAYDSASAAAAVEGIPAPGLRMRRTG